MTDTLTFLPQPRSLRRADGSFELDGATRLQVSAQASAETVHAARGLQEALTEAFGLTLAIVPVERPVRDDALSLVLLGRDDGTFPAAEFGWESPADLGQEGYTLQVDEQGATVAATAEAGLFYGVQTLIQLAKSAGRVWPALTISDRPALAARGLMLDVSRMKVPRLETLEHLARTLAHYKYNQLQLYTEHTFRFPSHPEIGSNAGSLTGDDILALDAVCRPHHVELVPNLQSLGHHRALLNLPQYEHLSETSWKWTLATANEETFKLVDELYTDMLPSFSSRWFNVGADEPWDMGHGQSKALMEELGGVGRLYLHHVKRLHELVTKHGRQMMMWADMFWHHPDLIGEFPEDILLLDWWYEPKERFDSVDVLAKAGRRFYVCPGTSSWTSLFPRLENAIANVRGFVRDGIASGAEGMLMTDWGDNGHYQPLSNSWYPYLWAAETAWTGAKTEVSDFDKAFGRLFLGDASGIQVTALRRLGAAMTHDPEWVRSWNTAMALYEEPLDGKLADITPPEVIAEARAAADAIFPLLSEVRDSGLRHDLGLAAAQIRFATEKVETTRAAKALLAELAGHASPTDNGRQRFDALIATMRRHRDRLPAIEQEFEQRWLVHARPSEIHVNLSRYEKLIAQYGIALEWLEAQRNVYSSGGKVDGDLSTYDRKGYAVLHEESRRWIFELVDVIGMDALPPDIQGWLGIIDEAESEVAESR